jgi:hypothetical protein
LATATTENPRQYWLCGKPCPQTYAQQGFTGRGVRRECYQAAEEVFKSLYFIENIVCALILNVIFAAHGRKSNRAA